MWNVKYKRNKTKQRHTYRNREQISGYQWGEGWGVHSFPTTTPSPYSLQLSLLTALFQEKDLHLNSFRQLQWGQFFFLSLLGLDSFQLKIIHIPKRQFRVATFAPLQLQTRFCSCSYHDHSHRKSSLLPLLMLVIRWLIKLITECIWLRNLGRVDLL